MKKTKNLFFATLSYLTVVTLFLIIIITSGVSAGITETIQETGTVYDSAGKCYAWPDYTTQVPCDISIDGQPGTGYNAGYDFVTEVWTNWDSGVTYKSLISCFSGQYSDAYCTTVKYLGGSGEYNDGTTASGIVHISEFLITGDLESEMTASSIAKAASGGTSRPPSGGTTSGGTSSGGGGGSGASGAVGPQANTGYVANSKLASTTADPEGIMKVLKMAVNILSGAVMVAAVIMLIIAAIQYSAAGGEPNGVKSAKTKITNVLIGVVAYVFLYAFMNWLIPGGLTNIL